MLDLNKKKDSGNPAPSQLDGMDREIAATDNEIDKLVYELYDLTDEEIQIIERASVSGFLTVGYFLLITNPQSIPPCGTD